MERDLPGPACRGRWGWWARLQSRQRRRPSRALCSPIPPGGKTTRERERERTIRMANKRGDGDEATEKKDSVRSNSLHTALPNIHNLSLTPSHILAPHYVIRWKKTLCEFQGDPASLLPGCCVDSWTDKSFSALPFILSVSLSLSLSIQQPRGDQSRHGPSCCSPRLRVCWLCS